VALYEAENHPFVAPQNLPPEQAKGEAREYFDYWFEQGQSAKLGADFYVAQGKERDAAFLFHQAVERLYHCTLLVQTLYSPKSHKLNFLRGHAEEVAPSLIAAWPRDDRFSRRCFELLRQAYVNARYSQHYKVSAEELAWLGERVAVLRDLVRVVCEARLAPIEG
jgi:HEPN domain-containing protein